MKHEKIQDLELKAGLQAKMLETFKNEIVTLQQTSKQERAIIRSFSWDTSVIWLLRSWCIAESKTDAEEDKMEIDEPTAEEAPSAAPEEVIESTDKPDSPEKPSSLDKSAPAEPPAEATITATEVTPDLEEPIVKDTVVKEPAVKEPSEPVALPAEKTTEEIVPVPEIQATEVEPSEQAPASNAVPKVEEPPSATTSQQAQGIPVPDASAPNGVSKPDVSSVVSSESKGGL